MVAFFGSDVLKSPYKETRQCQKQSEKLFLLRVDSFFERLLFGWLNHVETLERILV